MYAKEAVVEERTGVLQWIKDLAVLLKLRLTFLVVVSSGVGYAIGATAFSWVDFGLLSLSGFLVAGAANAFNQVIERDLDSQMKRTMKRPLAMGRMSTITGLIVGSISSILGLFILYLALNPLSAILGLLAIFSYAALYTPLKRVSSWAVFVGAFPGAIPPMLGYVAATGKFDLFAGLLFAVQFIWQFPHFWAIAWVLDDDYKQAGFRLLPSPGGRNRQSAFINLVYNLFLIPVSLTPWAFGLTSVTSAYWAVGLSVLFAVPAFQLYKSLKVAHAKVLMFASFFYLPAMLLVYWLTAN